MTRLPLNRLASTLVRAFRLSRNASRDRILMGLAIGTFALGAAPIVAIGNSTAPLTRIPPVANREFSKPFATESLSQRILPVRFSGEFPPPVSPAVPSAIAASWQNPELILTIEGESATIQSLAFSPNGRLLAVGGGRNDPKIEVWDLQAEKRIYRLEGHQIRVLALAFSPDGKTLVSGGEGGLINVWDLETGELRHTLLDHSSHILSLAITPDGRNLVSGALDGMKLWDLGEMQLIGSLVKFQPIYAVAIRPDGRLIAGGDDGGNITLWPLLPENETPIYGNAIATPFVQDRGITTLAFTPDGGSLISGSLDSRIHRWDLVRGESIYTLVEHKSWIRSIQVNPKGGIFASVSRDGIRLWDLRTGELIGVLSVELNWAQTIAWSPDGNSIASGGLDRSVKIWRGGPPFEAEDPVAELRIENLE
ncbi:WD40 repeat domain-containing protein [Phormidium sp. CCY1219]|uniref:WD40 repeat domain-containing protein n=1 Tax=Phormidium sp. CCY1219 TaxID=2886104 RepID=UPI002D1F25BF|nr:WD40 repeat domain-containing protein [Phormidium sp. CCY1219]MEB3831200.1 WD40 repeat domain-containing protein [Phormidium sp. CCY1219]